mmetsp:Transcript_31390/g.82325  ORF Transcript_31390/g.82325 Transcript_31390/m.82325 type:complete len:294 (+) Transcript_31390:113-994(+)|eukprot:CAMPEP_0182916772 /NCGR_PEP_ID=MMETSP0105_2-20130417/1139_1 /TAXON_ID=81532 ORGANISM="Acanthoeca-like sp., Strain 10tr" /NCGR_SAMPLE_ID=MMETSP0105_2 /ASSEMBLY_ACC=CAM_ASM_000205 /LENGTH=293 /DNA_ID=CAMNT_0025053739 /DNA_START=178 /DNA_END=1059 /DNA_ORIENTATION=-
MGGSGSKWKFIEKSDPYSYWTIKGDLGSGSYGKVHLVQNRQDKSEAAAKIAEVESVHELDQFVVEIKILATCRHPNVCGFLTSYYHDNKLWIVIEKCSGGALGDLLDAKGGGLSEAELKVAGYQMCDALEFLHGRHIMHRDLNAANVLVSGAGLVKIADFGVSVVDKKNRRNSFIGSPNWMAPEVARCEQKKDSWYTNACDIWSLGVTMIELAESVPPHSDLHPVKVLVKIASGAPPKLTHPENFSSETADFIYRMLKKEPKERASATELKAHSFVRDQEGNTLKSLLEAVGK